MSFSPSRTLEGFEYYGKVGDECPIMMLPGNPGDTYTKGDAVLNGATTGNYGVVIAASDSSADIIGFVAKTTVCPAATQAFPVPGSPAGDLDGAASKCLIPVMVDVPAGKRIWKGNIYANAKDETVVSYTSSTRAIALTTGLGTDAYGAGALVYVYEGPGKGEVNIVESYDHTGGAAELLLVCHRAFNTTLTTASKLLIIAGGAAAGDGLTSCFSRCDLDDEDAFDAGDGYDDGNWLTFMDWNQIGGLMAEGAILGIRAAGQTVAG